VNNREDDPHAKLQYDMDYIQRMSIWLDIKILFMSVFNTMLARWDKRGGKESQQTGKPLP